MKPERLINHPIFSHDRSRSILIWFSISGFIIWSILWMNLQIVFKKAGIDPHLLARNSNFLCVMVSPYFHLGVTVLSATIASALTARHIVGPMKRIQEWLLDWEAGNRISPLQVRSDQYHHIVHLLNELHDKAIQNKSKRQK